MAEQHRAKDLLTDNRLHRALEIILLTEKGQATAAVIDLRNGAYPEKTSFRIFFSLFGFREILVIF